MEKSAELPLSGKPGSVSRGSLGSFCWVLVAVCAAVVVWKAVAHSPAPSATSAGVPSGCTACHASRRTGSVLIELERPHGP